jgi:hypothetical protein
LRVSPSETLECMEIGEQEGPQHLGDVGSFSDLSLIEEAETFCVDLSHDPVEDLAEKILLRAEVIVDGRDVDSAQRCDSS